MYILEIIPLQRGIPRDSLSYFSMREIPLGSLVEIPFRSKTIQGIVIHSSDARTMKASLRSNSFSLKPVGSVVEGERFPAQLLRGLQEISRDTLIPLGTLVATFFPDSIFDYFTKWTPLQERKIDIRIIELPEKQRFDHYVMLARESLAKNHSVLFITPTVAQTDRLMKRFSEAFDKKQIVTLTGAVKPANREKIYTEFENNSEPVIICATPQFFVIPLKTINCCVLESFHSPYYIQDFNQYYDYRFIIIKLAKIFGYLQYFADAIPSPEFSYFIDQRKAYLDRETKKTTHVPIAIIQKESFNDPYYKSAIFGSDVIGLLQEKIQKKIPIFIFTARKSIATATVCRDCNYTVTCPNCTAVMHLVKKNPLNDGDRVFICNRCDTEVPPMNRCPHCLGWNLIPLGVTVESVADELQKLFPDVVLYKSTQTLTSTESKCKKLVTTWQENGGILIGTQKILPYLNESPISIIASYEQCMSVPDFKTVSQTMWMFQNLLEKTTGHFIIQTRDKNEEFLQLYKKQDLNALVAIDQDLRKTYHYPPNYVYITIEISEIARRDHVRAKDFLKNPLQPFEHTVQSQFFEISQTYTITAKIHIPQDHWAENDIEIMQLRGLLTSLKSHTHIEISGLWSL